MKTSILALAARMEVAARMGDIGAIRSALAERDFATLKPKTQTGILVFGASWALRVGQWAAGLYLMDCGAPANYLMRDRRGDGVAVERCALFDAAEAPNSLPGPTLQELARRGAPLPMRNGKHLAFCQKVANPLRPERRRTETQFQIPAEMLRHIEAQNQAQRRFDEYHRAEMRRRESIERRDRETFVEAMQLQGAILENFANPAIRRRITLDGLGTGDS